MYSSRSINNNKKKYFEDEKGITLKVNTISTIQNK